MEQRLSDDFEGLDLEYPDAPPENKGAGLGDFISLFPLLGRWELRAVYCRWNGRWELDRRIGPKVEQYQYDDDETVIEFIRREANRIEKVDKKELADTNARTGSDRGAAANVVATAGTVTDAAATPETPDIRAADYGFFYYPDEQRLYVDRPVFYDSGKLDWVWTDCYLVRMLAPGRAVLYDLCDDHDFGQCCRAYLLDRIDDPAEFMLHPGKVQDCKS